MGDTMGLATMARDSATPSGDSSEPEVMERKHRVSLTAWCSIKQSSGPIQLQEMSHQDSDPKIESNGSAKEDTPVGLRTRSRMQQETSSATNPDEDGPERQTESEIKDLILKLITQAKEQRSEINAMRAALKNGLEQQESLVRELKGEIAELRMQNEKIQVQRPISDPQPLVKRFTPSGELSFGDSPTTEFSLRWAGKNDEIQEIRESPVTAIAYMNRAILQDTPSDHDTSELNSRSSTHSNENEAQDTSGDANSSEINSRSVIEPDANEITNIDESNLVQSEQMSPSVRSSKEYESRNETELQEEERHYEPSYTKDTRHWPGQQSSKEYQRQHSPYSYGRTGGWRKGGEIPNYHRKNVFEAPTAPVDVRMEALRRIDEALNKVPDAVHFHAKSERTAVTLFAGNLDFKARGMDMMRSLRTHFHGRVKIEEIDIPNYHGKHRGYGFFTLSWVRKACVDPADICKAFSGVIQVKSRRLYFQELHSDVANKEQEKVYAARHATPQEPACSGFYVGPVGF